MRECVQLVELKNGETYNGHLVNCDTWMNIHLRDVICTSRVSCQGKWGVVQVCWWAWPFIPTEGVELFTMLYLLVTGRRSILENVRVLHPRYFHQVLEDPR